MQYTCNFLKLYYKELMHDYLSKVVLFNIYYLIYLIYLIYKFAYTV